jgi:hypothetical protein
MSEVILHNYENLYGVASGRLQGPCVGSVTAMLVAFRKHRIVSAAGDHGAISVWIADDKSYRCGFYRYCSPVDEQSFSRKSQVYAWLVEWFPKLRKEPA